MSTELLLEVGSKVQKVFSLTQTPGHPFLKSALVIVLPDCINIVHAESGSIYYRYDFGRKTNFGDIIDCVYLHNVRCFLVAFTDSSLMVMPLECKSVIDCERTVWPRMPSCVHTNDGKSAVVNCVDGSNFLFSLTNEGTIPTADLSGSPSCNEGSLNYSHCSSRYLVQISGSSDTEISAQPTKKKQKTAMKEVNKNQLNLAVWPLHGLMEGTCLQLLIQDCIFQQKLSVLSTERIVGIMCHNRSECISVVLANDNNQTQGGRWLKLSLDGSVLFERKIIGAVPIYCVEIVENNSKNNTAQICVLTSEYKLTFWDLRYGTAVKSVDCSSSISYNNSNDIRSHWVVVTHESANNSITNTNRRGVCQLVTSTNTKAGSKSCNIHTRTINTSISGVTATSSSSFQQQAQSHAVVSSNDGSLCSSLGKLSKGSTAATTTAAVGSSDEKVAPAIFLSRVQKRKLNDAAIEYAQQVELEQQQQQQDHIAGADRKNYRKCCVDVPIDAAKAFLVQFCTKRSEYTDGDDTTMAAVDDDDDDVNLVKSNNNWKIVKMLARSGYLSIATHPTLITQALAAHRFDVLQHIVEYAIDLSEHQCVQILLYIMTHGNGDKAVDIGGMEEISIVNGVIQWQHKATTANKSMNEVTTAPVITTASKKKKGKQNKVDEIVAPVSVVISNDVVTSSAPRIDLLRAMVESTLLRPAAFSSILLSEAVQQLPLTAAVLLLRVSIHMMRGLCENSYITNNNNDHHYHNNGIERKEATMMMNNNNFCRVHLHPYLSDDHIKRSVTWIEALLDGHFSALAFHAVTDAATRRALTVAMQTIHGAESAAEQIQATLGVWTHIYRVLHNGGQQVRPITSLYQVEHLSV